MEAGSGLAAAPVFVASGLVVLVTADAAVGLLAAGAVAGLVTSFLTRPVVLGGCAAAVRPAEGAVAPGLEAAGLPVGAEAPAGFEVAEERPRRVGAVAGLVVLGTVVLSVLAAAGLGAAADDVGLGAVVLGLVPFTGPAGGLLAAMPLVPAGPLVPLDAVAAEAGLAAPTGFLSAATLVWVLAGDAAAVAPPTGLFARAAGAPAPVAVVFFLSGAGFLAKPSAAGFTPFTMRLWAAPVGRAPGPVAPGALAPATPPGLALAVAATPLVLALGSAALPLASLRTGGAVGGFSGCCCCVVSPSSGFVGGGACWGNSSSVATVAEAPSPSASVGSMVAMATPSGFIPLGAAS